MSSTREQTDVDYVGFLRNYYKEEVFHLARLYPREKRSIEIDWMDLYQHDPGLADDLRDQPDQIIGFLEEALTQMDVPVDIHDDLERAHVRVTNIPESDTYSVGEYRSDQIGNFLSVSGQVTKTSPVKPRPLQLAYQCERCGTRTVIPQDGTQLKEPHECKGCERQGPFTAKYEDDRSQFVDHQLVRVQEPPEETQGGEGEHIDVHIEDDLVGSVSAGDRAELGGVLNIEAPDGDQVTFSQYMHGHSTRVEETDFEEIDVGEHLDEVKAIAAGEYGDPFELLVDSIAPKIDGYEYIKESVALQMFGGSRVQYPDGSYDRGDSHILLLGDPGTAKSTFLRAVEEMAPRSAYASGKGATASGLTASTVRDDFGDTEWSLKAGALVLANKGVACIDEIDKVKDDAVSSLHDALESQRVNINKAGINASLPAQTALLAAGNPEYGRFDPDLSFAEQINLGPTLLSRFDLIFLLSDRPEREEDKRVANHMVSSRQDANTRAQHKGDGEDSSIDPAIEPDVLRAYVAHAKQTVTPYIDDEEVQEELVDSFTEFRHVNGETHDTPVPVTRRKLEAIQRLAEASARARLSETVEMEDIERARRLVGRSLRDVGIDPESDQLDADIIETGSSNSQRDRIKKLEEFIKEMEDETDGRGAPIDELIELMNDIGYSARQVRGSIDTLKNKGKVYHPDDLEENISWL